MPRSTSHVLFDLTAAATTHNVPLRIDAADLAHLLILADLAHRVCTAPAHTLPSLLTEARTIASSPSVDLSSLSFTLSSLSETISRVPHR